MRVAYSVTYEFPERAPLTHRGVIAGAQEATCVSRAIRQARRVLRPRCWSSVVCVLLGRLDDEVDAAEGQSTEDADRLDRGDRVTTDEGRVEHEVERTCEASATSSAGAG